MCVQHAKIVNENSNNNNNNVSLYSLSCLSFCLHVVSVSLVLVFIDLHEFVVGADTTSGAPDDGQDFIEEDEDEIELMVGDNMLQAQPREVRARLWYGAIGCGAKEPRQLDVSEKRASGNEVDDDHDSIEAGMSTSERAWSFIARAKLPTSEGMDIESFYADFLRRTCASSPDTDAVNDIIGGGDDDDAVRAGTSSAHHASGSSSSVPGESMTNTTEIISRDLNRTFPNHRHFHSDEAKTALFNVLFAYSQFDVAVGYCQGMAFVAGMLLMYLPEHAAFAALTWMMSPQGTYGGLGLRDYYSPGLATLQSWLETLDAVIFSLRPRLAAHMAEHCVSPVMYASDWILTSFAYTFPSSFACRVLDLILTEHSVMPVLKIGIMLLAAAETEIMACQSIEGIIMIIKVEIPKWGVDRLEGILCSAAAMQLKEADLVKARQMSHGGDGGGDDPLPENDDDDDDDVDGDDDTQGEGGGGGGGGDVVVADDAEAEGDSRNDNVMNLLN